MKCILYLSAFLICINFIQAQNTTTSAPITTTTPVPTSPVPTPPLPTEGTWNITEDGITCIRADLKIRFKIPVENETEYLVLLPSATTKGSNCNVTNTIQLLVLNSDDFVLTFVFEKDSGKTFVRNMTLAVSSSEEFYYNSTEMYSVQNGHSFMCKSTLSIPMGNATMEIFEIHIQAFGGTEKDFGVVEECEADDSVSDIVPIAVACALAALIIIVLIAYLVGRRRSRQKGYNSV